MRVHTFDRLAVRAIAPAAAPRILAGATLAFLIAGVLAIWWPALRAARVDPAAILKDS